MLFHREAGLTPGFGQAITATSPSNEKLTGAPVTKTHPFPSARLPSGASSVFFLGFLHSAPLAGTNYYHERNQHPLGSYPITDTVVGVNRGEDESRPAQGLLLL
jgi:hypothetical protein